MEYRLEHLLAEEVAAARQRRQRRRRRQEQGLSEMPRAPTFIRAQRTLHARALLQLGISKPSGSHGDGILSARTELRPQRPPVYFQLIQLNSYFFFIFFYSTINKKRVELNRQEICKSLLGTGVGACSLFWFNSGTKKVVVNNKNGSQPCSATQCDFFDDASRNKNCNSSTYQIWQILFKTAH